MCYTYDCTFHILPTDVYFNECHILKYNIQESQCNYYHNIQVQYLCHVSQIKISYDCINE